MPFVYLTYATPFQFILTFFESYYHLLLLTSLLVDFMNIQDIIHSLDMLLLHIIVMAYTLVKNVFLHHNIPLHMVEMEVEVDEVVKEAMVAEEV